MSKTVAIRDLDEETFRKFRAVAIEERMKTGEALSIAMKKWIKEKETRKIKTNPENLLKINGIIKTKNKVKWSEEIDEFLYGLEK
ncbi:MAG: hypothetical protein HYT72_04765 [Candidatus Aenigmarchaeota archaeon]|nr:hypothetical protein [Candidatus Aenigmarchaeota archaeon]